MKWCIPITLPWPTERFSAITIWPFVFMNKAKVTEELKRNEQAHVWHWLHLGWIGFPFVYGFFHFRNMLRGDSWMMAYWNNPIERESRAAEDPAYEQGFLTWRRFL